MPCGAVGCRGVPWGAVLCRAVPCCVLAVLTISYNARYHSKYGYQVPVLLYHVCTYIFYHKKCTPTSQLNPSIPQHRSAAPCGVVRCHASWLRFSAVPCCTVLSLEHTAPSIMRSTRYQAPVCTGVLLIIIWLFSYERPLSFVSVFYFFPQTTPCYRPERGIADKHTAQHRATSSAHVALGIVKSLSTRNHGPRLSAPFTVSCILPCASVAGGRPLRGALVHIWIAHRFCCLKTFTTGFQNALKRAGLRPRAGLTPSLTTPFQDPKMNVFGSQTRFAYLIDPKLMIFRASIRISFSGRPQSHLDLFFSMSWEAISAVTSRKQR